MCCRFYTDDTTKKDILRLVGAYDQKINWLREGDVRPGDMATVITAGENTLYAKDMTWGKLFNARSETVKTKPVFAESYERRRCVIPVKHFYEWDPDKNKVEFTVEGERSVYLAGIYVMFAPSLTEFSVLTAAPGDSMKPVHDRQPLILREEELEDWIFSAAEADRILQKAPMELTLYREFEQLSLSAFFS